MDTILAILAAIGVYVGVPIVGGLIIAGVYILKDSKARKVEHAKVLEAVAEARARIA